MKPRSRIHSLAAALAAILFVPALLAQPQPPPSVDQTLKLNARLVVLDVTVTDASGKPVPGLTEKDFQVLEDGKPQRIRSFEPPSSHALPAASLAQGSSAVFDPAAPAAFGNSPVTILVLDQLNTHFADTSFARRSLHDYLAAQPALLASPATLLTVSEGRFQLAEPFTRDRDSLQHALAAVPAAYPWTLEVNGNAEHGPIERLDQTLRALEQIAQSYARIPGRKNLIWVGGGFPSPDPNTLDSADEQEIHRTLEHITNLLLETRVTLYSVDPTTTAAGMTEITDATQMAFAQAAGDSLAANTSPFDTSADFDRLGPITGGRVVRARNDVAQQIASAIALADGYYTLSYTPSSTNDAAAAYRRIRVVCLRPGLTVATRTGYFTASESESKNKQSTTRNTVQTASYDLSTALESSVPLNAVHLTVAAATDPAAPPNTYVVHVSAADLTWSPRSGSAQAGTTTASVYILAAALGTKSKVLNHTLHGMTATAGAAANLRDPGKTADFIFSLSPAPPAGTTALRFIVRDSATGRMGSVDISLPKPE